MTRPKAPTPPTQAQIDRRLQAAAFDLMCRPVHLGGQRRLRPPPYRFDRVSVTAAAMALRADRKAGIV